MLAIVYSVTNRIFEKWHFEPFPNAANILDYVRGSIKFANVQDLYDGLCQFIEYIDTNYKDSKCSIIGIVQCTNDFNKYLNHTNEYNKSYRYCDIKLNVVIVDRQTNEAMIGEVQFIVDWMLNAKKRLRKYKFISNHTNFIAKVYDRVVRGRIEFNRTVKHLMNEQDYDSLVKYMLFFENRILSMFNDNRPLMYDCIKHKFYKAFYFFQDSVKHFSRLLGSLDKQNTDFQVRYFTVAWQHTIDCRKGLIWHLPVPGAKETDFDLQARNVLCTLLGLKDHKSSTNATFLNCDIKSLIDSRSKGDVFFSKVLNYQLPNTNGCTVLKKILENTHLAENLRTFLLAIPGINVNFDAPNKSDKSDAGNWFIDDLFGPNVDFVTPGADMYMGDNDRSIHTVHDHNQWFSATYSQLIDQLKYGKPKPNKLYVHARRRQERLQLKINCLNYVQSVLNAEIETLKRKVSELQSYANGLEVTVAIAQSKAVEEKQKNEQLCLEIQQLNDEIDKTNPELIMNHRIHELQAKLLEKEYLYEKLKERQTDDMHSKQIFEERFLSS